MGLSLRGTTSGAIDINAPAVAGDNTITLPANNGSANQFFKNSGTAGIVTYSSMLETPAGDVGVVGKLEIGPLAGVACTISSAGAVTAIGAITAAGNIQSGDYSPYGVRLKGLNGITVKTDATAAREVFGIYDADNSNTLKFQIKADGGGRFANTLWGGTVDGGSTSTTSFASRFYNNSAFPTVYAKNMGNGGLWQGVNSSGSETSKIDSDGDVIMRDLTVRTVTSSDQLISNRSGTSVCIRAQSSGSDNFIVQADGKVKVSDNGRFTCGTDDDLALRHSGTTAVLENNTGSLYIDQLLDDGDVYIRSDNGSGGSANYFQASGGDGQARLFHYGTQKFNTTASGIEVSGATPIVEINASGNTQPTIELQQSGTAYAKFLFDGNHVQFGNFYSGGATKLYGGNAERIRINSNGRVDVGDELGVAHAGQFQVIHTGGGQQDNDCLAFFETNANDWCIITNSNEPGNNSHYHIYFYESGSGRGRIFGLYGQNVQYATGSDYRWKENIVEMTGTEGIDICKKLKPSKFNWIKNREGTGKINTVDGFIAHEVEEAGVLGAVSGEKDAVNEDGSIDGQMLDYGQMTPVLAAAIKGLIAKVETLEVEIAALKGS